MAQFFSIHPNNPQARLIQRAVAIVQGGGLIAYPTDSAYALGCHIGDKQALDRISNIRQLDKRHNFTLMCRSLSEIATYGAVDNQVFRWLKAHTPGPFTFILKATSETPRRLKHPKRKTIGVRIPSSPIVLALLTALNEPMMTATLILPNDDMPLTDPHDIRDVLEHQLDLVIDGGFCGMEATTVVDFTEAEPQVVRQGCGNFRLSPC